MINIFKIQMGIIVCALSLVSHASSGKYSVMGVDDDNKVESFFKSIQQDIKSDNIAALSEKVSYPLRVYTATEKLNIKSKQMFISNYRQFMNKDLKTALLCQTNEDLKPSSSGLRAARGAIWINSVFQGKPESLDMERHNKGLDKQMWKLKITSLSSGQMATLVAIDCGKQANTNKLSTQHRQKLTKPNGLSITS